MKQFLFTSAALLAIVTAVQLSPAPTAQTTQSLKTAWGEPDLQGIWTDPYQTPLQRPPQYAGKEFFTDEEVAALDEQRAKRRDRDYRNLEAYPRGTVNDLQGSYNGVYHMMRKSGRRTSLIVDPPDGRIPPLTPEAVKRQADIRAFYLEMAQASPACKNQERSCRGGKYGPVTKKWDQIPPHYSKAVFNRANGPEDRSLGERCLGGFNLEFANQNGFTRRIVQTRGGISIFYDSGQGQGWQRNIVMNATPHLPTHIRQWWGDSRGRWEGDTLVIDVTNFTPKTQNQGAAENLHLVERFRRTGPETLEYSVTVEDPTTWTKPWTVKTEYAKQDEQQNRIYTEPRCHEGNYGLGALLRGSRIDDDAFAKGRGPHPAELCTDGCGYVDDDAVTETDPLGGGGGGGD
jgi:hypothetical protein